jgi:hypothetical protein
MSVFSKINIIFTSIIFSLFCSQAMADEEWWGIAHYEAQVGMGDFDCGTAIRLVMSEPILITTYQSSISGVDRSALKIQFLSYLYDNHLKQLDQVAGRQSMSNGGVIFFKDRQTTIDKAKQRGLFGGPLDCDSDRRGSVVKIPMSDFKYIVPTTGKYAGMNEQRYKLLNNYMSKK